MFTIESRDRPFYPMHTNPFHDNIRHPFQTAHLSLEAIARGNVRPSRAILFVDDEQLFNHPTKGLQRLMKRGLEIQLVKILNHIRNTIHFLNWLKISTVPMQRAMMTIFTQNGG